MANPPADPAADRRMRRALLSLRLVDDAERAAERARIDFERVRSLNDLPIPNIHVRAPLRTTGVAFDISHNPPNSTRNDVYERLDGLGQRLQDGYLSRYPHFDPLRIGDRLPDIWSGYNRIASRSFWPTYQNNFPYPGPLTDLGGDLALAYGRAQSTAARARRAQLEKGEIMNTIARRGNQKRHSRRTRRKGGSKNGARSRKR